MKDILLAIGLKIGGCILDCLGRKAWQERRRIRRENEELAEAHRKKQAELEKRISDAYRAAKECRDFLPPATDRQNIKKFGPKSKKVKHGNQSSKKGGKG